MAQMKEYKSTLFGLSLNKDALKRLDQILSEGPSTFPLRRKTIRISFDGFSQNYGSIDELISDPTKPDVVKEMSLEYIFADSNTAYLSRYREDISSIWIYYNDTPFPATIEMKGPSDWVISTKEKIAMFSKKERQFFRSLFNNFYFLAAVFLLGYLEIATGSLTQGVWSIGSLFFVTGLASLLFCIVQFVTRFRISPFEFNFKERHDYFVQLLINVLGSIIFSALLAVAAYFVNSA